MIMIMSMSSRLQIPITRGEHLRLRAAARKAGLTLAEWSRRQLRQKADEVLVPQQTREAALEALFRLNGPVADIETMIEESVRGRLR